jgi:DNA replication and repair protein RecF
LLRDHRPRPEIAAFDPELIENGDHLTSVRAELSTALAPLIATAVHDIGGQTEEVSLRYVPGSPESLGVSLIASRERETQRRQTVVGPHRDDLAIELNGMEAAKFASEGQQRTLAIALKLAQTRLLIERTGVTPTLLIDDVFGELDVHRRTNLLAHLPPDSQRIVTTTHLDWLGSRSGLAIFTLSDRTLTSR